MDGWLEYCYRRRNNALKIKYTADTRAAQRTSIEKCCEDSKGEVRANGLGQPANAIQIFLYMTFSQCSKKEKISNDYNCL